MPALPKEFEKLVEYRALWTFRSLGFKTQKRYRDSLVRGRDLSAEAERSLRDWKDSRREAGTDFVRVTKGQFDSLLRVADALNNKNSD